MREDGMPNRANSPSPSPWLPYWRRPIAAPSLAPELASSPVLRGALVLCAVLWLAGCTKTEEHRKKADNSGRERAKEGRVTAAPSQPAPSQPAPSQPAPSQPAPSAPKLSPASADLTLPTGAETLAPWLTATGCPWAARDGSEVLCWWRSVDERGRQSVALRLVRAPGTEERRFVLYHRGEPPFTASAVRPDAVKAVQTWLRDRGARRGADQKMPVKLTHNRLTVRWHGMDWGMALREPPKVAPTTKLGGREGLCCRWQPADATLFSHCGLLVLRLQLDCDWHRLARDRHDLCADADLQLPANRAMGQVSQPDTLHFIPVGGR